MNSISHGVFSLSLIFFSIIIGLLSILSESLPMGLLYVAIILIFPLIVVYSFCSKCMCRLDFCGHILPGKLTKLLPPRKQNNYTVVDIIGVVAPLTVLLVFPPFWLWKTKILFIIFWLLFLIALAEIKLFVCRKCKNEKCPEYIKKNWIDIILQLCTNANKKFRYASPKLPSQLLLSVIR